MLAKPTQCASSASNSKTDTSSTDTSCGDLDGSYERIHANLDAICASIDELTASDSLNGCPQPISFVVPIKDEQETLAELVKTIDSNVPLGCDYEIILVDDGSTDRSWEVIQQLAGRNGTRVRGLRFRHNAGKATALTAGFNVARGDIIFTLDADLQDDPREIPRFLEKLNEGFDIVSGWKRTRFDPWHKVFPSRIFNRMLSAASGVAIHDHNCGYKCYRAHVAKTLRLHGELHRMIPALAATQGYTVSEIEVRHHPRMYGQSKYGVERFFRGFSDLLTVGFLRRFHARPSHFINGIAAVYGLMALLFIGVGVGIGAAELRGMIALATGAILGSMSLCTVLVGLICELVIRRPISTVNDLPIAEDTQSQSNPPRSQGYKQLTEFVK